MIEERIITIPEFGCYMFQVDTETLEPVGMYCYKDDLEKNAKELEWIDDEDQKSLCDKKNFKQGRNNLFVYAKHLDFVKRIWAYCDFIELI